MFLWTERTSKHDVSTGDCNRRYQEAPVKTGKSYDPSWFFCIKTRSLSMGYSSVLSEMHVLFFTVFFSLDLGDWHYPAASHFPNVNCILSRRRNVHECNVIVFFQPLQAKHRLTWVGTCETKYCFYLSELAIMDQERNTRTNQDVLPSLYFPRLGLHGPTERN